MAAALVTGHAGFGQGLTLPLINQAALLQGPLAVALALFAAHGCFVSDQSVDHQNDGPAPIFHGVSPFDRASAP